MRLVITCSVVVLGGTAAFLACSNSKSPNGNNGTQDASVVSDSGELDGGPAPEDAGYGYTTPHVWDQPVPRPSDDAGAAARASCAFARGACQRRRSGRARRSTREIPIDNIVVVMMENRSFDSMFGHLNEYGNRTDVEEPPRGRLEPGAGRRLGDNGPLDAGTAEKTAGGRGQQRRTRERSRGCTRSALLLRHRPQLEGAALGLGQRPERRLLRREQRQHRPAIAAPGRRQPARTASARCGGTTRATSPSTTSSRTTFAIADHYFCSLLGPTDPNRDYLMAATSFGADRQLASRTI